MLMRGATRRSSELCGLEEIFAVRDCVDELMVCIVFWQKPFLQIGLQSKQKDPLGILQVSELSS